MDLHVLHNVVIGDHPPPGYYQTAELPAHPCFWWVSFGLAYTVDGSLCGERAVAPHPSQNHAYRCSTLKRHKITKFLDSPANLCKENPRRVERGTKLQPLFAHGVPARRQHPLAAPPCLHAPHHRAQRCEVLTLECDLLSA